MTDHQVNEKVLTVRLELSFPGFPALSEAVFTPSMCSLVYTGPFCGHSPNKKSHIWTVRHLEISQVSNSSTEVLLILCENTIKQTAGHKRNYGQGKMIAEKNKPELGLMLVLGR